MFRLRTDEDVHVDMLHRGVLRVRRLTKGIQRWEHELDLTGVYADRFDKPIADPIDGWFDGDGALRLIVHVRDNARLRLLPPRELTFAADGPRLERSRPGSDRNTLGLAPLRTHAHDGTTFSIVAELDDHVLVVIDAAEGHRLGWSIADQPRIGFRWMERSEIGNPERPGGACGCSAIGRFAAEHLPGMNPVAVDRERGETRRTVECNRCLTSWQIVEVREPGTLEVLWKWTRIGSRSPQAIAEAAATILARAAETQSLANRPLISPALKRGRVCVEGIDHPEGFEVVDESPDLIELATDTGVQTFDKTDPRLGGFLGLVEHRGYRLRLIERRPDEVHVLAFFKLGPLLGIHEDDATAFGWVIDSGDPPPRPLLDRELIRGLKSFTDVMYAPLARSFHVIGETATTLLLWGHDEELEVPKLDGRIPGPFSRWVRYRENLLRVIAEREGHVLAVAHPVLGARLHFTEVWPMGHSINQSVRWLPLGEVEAVSPPTIYPAV